MKISLYDKQNVICFDLFWDVIELSNKIYLCGNLLYIY